MAQITAYPCPHCGHNPISMANPDFTLRQGSLLGGKYVVGKLLGQGGFGITYVGWDLALDHKIAIKEYFPSGQVSRHPSTGNTLLWFETEQARYSRHDGMEVFLRETRKMSKVDNISHVVRVWDVFMENETAYIVMDYIEGETLKTRLQRTGPMDWDAARPIFLSAVQTMAEVHDAGIIHRDLSPDNLMLTPDGSVMILDLGAAKDLNVHSGASSMQVAKGGFSPLEQYTQRGGSGTWTDVYALAATIYYTLTGVLPPAAIDRTEDDTLRWDLPRLRTLPGSVATALKKALSVRAKDRTQTMTELLRQLSAAEKPGFFGRRGREAKKKEIVPPPPKTARKPEPAMEGHTQSLNNPDAKPETNATPEPPKDIESKPETKVQPVPPKANEPKPETKAQPEPPKVKEPQLETKPAPVPEKAAESEPEKKSAAVQGKGKMRLPVILLAAAVLVLVVGAALLLGKPDGKTPAQLDAPADAASPANTEAAETEPTASGSAAIDAWEAGVFTREVEADGNLHIRADNLDAYFDALDRIYRVSLSGLELQSSYVTNLPTSQKDLAEYCWAVTFTGDFGDTTQYSVSTTSWAFDPGANTTVTLDQMQTTLWKLKESSDSYQLSQVMVRLSYTSDTLCWELVDLAGTSFDPSKVTEITIDITLPGEYQSESYLPAAEAPETSMPVLEPGTFIRRVESDGKLHLRTNTLDASYDEASRVCRVTLTGLELQSSYTTNLSSSPKNTPEYAWLVQFLGDYGDTVGYEVGTIGWAFTPGETTEKTLADMDSHMSKYELTPIGSDNTRFYVTLTHTSDTLCWEFYVPRGSSFDLSRVDELRTDIQILEDYQFDTYLPAAGDSASASTPSKTSPPLTAGSDTFTMQTSGGVTTVDTDNLAVRMTGDGLCTVTLSGLTLEGSYITDKSSTTANSMEYSWGVKFTGPGWAYDVRTYWIAFHVGDEVERTLEDMKHAVWEHEGTRITTIADAQMTHTDDSITWTFTLPADFSQAAEIVAFFSGGPYGEIVMRTYTRTPAA